MSDDYSVSLWSRPLVIKAHSGHVACSVNKSGAFEFVQLLLIPKPGGSGLISWWEGKVENPHLDERRVCGAAVNSLSLSSTAQPSPHVVCSQKKEQQISNVEIFFKFTYLQKEQQIISCNLIFTKKRNIYLLLLSIHLRVDGESRDVCSQKLRKLKTFFRVKISVDPRII